MPSQTTVRDNLTCVWGERERLCSSLSYKAARSLTLRSLHAAVSLLQSMSLDFCSWLTIGVRYCACQTCVCSREAIYNNGHFWMWVWLQLRSSLARIPTPSIPGRVFFLLFGRGPRPRPNSNKKARHRPKNIQHDNRKAQTTKKTRQQKGKHSCPASNVRSPKLRVEPWVLTRLRAYKGLWRAAFTVETFLW